MKNFKLLLILMMSVTLCGCSFHKNNENRVHHKVITLTEAQEKNAGIETAP